MNISHNYTQYMVNLMWVLNNDWCRHLEKQSELLLDAYRSMSHELQRRQVSFSAHRSFLYSVLFDFPVVYTLDDIELEFH